jgi:hypothetical protein
MAFRAAAPKVEPRAAPATLKAAFDEAMDFPTSRAIGLQRPSSSLTEKANEETSFGRIIVDEHGLTAGTRLHILEPARALLAEWKEARRKFDVAIEPAMADINAVAALDRDIEAMSRKRDDEIAQAEQEFGQNHRYYEIKDDFEKAENRFKRLQLEHGNRAANMAATTPTYWVALFCLGVAEWLINYDVFFMFTGVVAIAAGATIVMGILLAFAAHGHGMILKQYSYRFGQDKDIRDRFSDWRLFWLATFSLLVVLGAAGGSRYAAVMHQMAGQTAPNLLGADATIEFNPTRDILLSLLWNVMAWAAGVFVAYFAHDKDPNYMDATRQRRRASRAYHRFRRPLVDKLRTIEARFAREIEARQNAATSRSAHVETERKLLEQVEAHETALVNAIAGVTRNAAQAYHSVLAQLAISQRGALTIERTGGPAMTPGEFRSQKVLISPDLIRGLA